MTLEEIKKTGSKEDILKYRTDCVKKALKEYREQMHNTTQSELQAHVIQSALDNDTNTVIATAQVKKSCETCKHDELFGCPSFIHDRCENYSEWEQADGEYITQSAGDEIRQKNYDLISRQAVLDTEYQVKVINDIEYVMLSEVQMKVRRMPSVAIPNKTIKCPHCEYVIVVVSSDFICPCCGEKMD